MPDLGGPLVYATPKRVRREIRKKDLVIVVLGLCAILAAVKWQTVARFYVTTQAYLAQRRAMSFEPSPPRVAYTDDEAVARQPRPTDGSRVHPYRTNVAYYSSPAWGEMQEILDADRVGFAHPRDHATVFLHARWSKGAGERLVVVEIFDAARTDGRERTLHLFVHSILPGSPITLWSETFSRDALDAGLSGEQRMTIYTGQSDAADPSHFTFAYTIDDKQGTVDGWLRADGSVDLKPRTGRMVRTYFGLAIWSP